MNKSDINEQKRKVEVEPKIGEFDVLKNFHGKIYSGMRIGGEHKWKYNNGIWLEKKVSPDEWKILFTSNKERFHQAPSNTGCEIGSKFHWFIISDQVATKTTSNTYETRMNGLKFKVGHKRPHWKNFSYFYPEQLSYKEKVIQILEEVLERLKNSTE